MSLDYTITSPLLISGTSISELKLNSGGNFINIITPSGLSNTYNFVLPPDIGVQRQILKLNPSLETEWVNRNIIYDIVSDTSTYSNTNSSYLLVPSMTLTPPANTYYVIFNTIIDDELEMAIFVDGTIINNSFRRTFSNDDKESITIIATTTVNGSQSIEVRARTTFTFSSYTIYRRTLFVNKIL